MKNVALLFAVVGAISLTACGEENPQQPNQEEVITTMKIIFSDSASLNVKTATFADPDGAGGAAPITYDTIKLDANKTYFTNIILLDESKNPVDTISNEVEEEKDDHLFVFNSTVNVTISITDLDNNGLPVGLWSKWKTTTASVGNTTIRLKHQPGIKTGDPNLGETDVEIVFPTKVF